MAAHAPSKGQAVEALAAGVRGPLMNSAGVYRLAAFDLDGTLVDSAPDLAHCLGRALEARGLAQPTVAQCRDWIGDGVEVLVRRGLEWGLGRAPGDAVFRRALEEFDRCYRERLFVDSRVYSGVAETLAVLRARGMILGCVTNKREGYAVRLLEQAGISRHLDFVYGGDSLGAKKPNPVQLTTAAERFEVPAHEAVMVGDSVNDIEAARAAGFDFVLAAYGYTGADRDLTESPLKIETFGGLEALLCGP